MLEKTWFSFCQSRALAAESEKRGTPGKLACGGVCHSCTSLSGCSNGSACRSTPCTRLKIAVLAPIPSAITMIATMAKHGLLIRWRKAWLRLSFKGYLTPQCCEGYTQV